MHELGMGKHSCPGWMIKQNSVGTDGTEVCDVLGCDVLQVVNIFPKRTFCLFKQKVIYLLLDDYKHRYTWSK